MVSLDNRCSDQPGGSLELGIAWFKADNRSVRFDIVSIATTLASLIALAMAVFAGSAMALTSATLFFSVVAKMGLAIWHFLSSKNSHPSEEVSPR